MYTVPRPPLLPNLLSFPCPVPPTPPKPSPPSFLAAMVNLWSEPAHVARYLSHADDLPHRAEGEAVLLELLPATVARVLDLGTGDGRLLAAVLASHPGVTAGVGLDMSPPMLAAARERFQEEPRVVVVRHNMDECLPVAGLLAAADAAHTAARASVSDDAAEVTTGNARGTTGTAAMAARPFDVILSSFAIHHLSDSRKRAAYAEAVEALLAPGGTFINMDLVASPTPALHAAFLAALGMAEDDPSDVLAPVADQLGMLRDAGLTDVDCYWKWREMAVLAGRKPGAGEA